MCVRMAGRLPNSSSACAIDMFSTSAIDGGQLAGATLDVFDIEPLPADSPLWRHPKITVTPHTAGRMSSARVAQNMVEMLQYVTSGAPLQNVVDWSKGY